MPADKKNKTISPTAKRSEAESLSLPDRFYIENNGNLSVEQLAHDLCKPIELVKSYCEAWNKTNPPKKKYRAKDLMDRPAKHGGVISMTEAASMVGDDAHNHSNFVTLDMINTAVTSGNVELVKKLKEKYEVQEQENRNVIKNKYKDIIHYIEPPDGKSGVF